MAKFWQIIKFSNFGALAYYEPNDLKFSSTLLYLAVSEIRTFFGKMPKLSKFLKNYKNFQLWCSCILRTLWSQICVRFALSHQSQEDSLQHFFKINVVPKFRPFRSISYCSEISANFKFLKCSKLFCPLKQWSKQALRWLCCFFGL